MAFADWQYVNYEASPSIGLSQSGGSFNWKGNPDLSSHQTHCVYDAAYFPIPPGKYYSIRAGVSADNGHRVGPLLPGVDQEISIFFGSKDRANGTPAGYLLGMKSTGQTHFVDLVARNRGGFSADNVTYDYGDVATPGGEPGQRSASLRMDIIPMYNGTVHDRDRVITYVNGIERGSHVIVRDVFDAKPNFAYRNDTSYGIGFFVKCSIPWARSTDPFDAQSISNFQIIEEDVV
jgi:hypothetical protein